MKAPKPATEKQLRERIHASSEWLRIASAWVSKAIINDAFETDMKRQARHAVKRINRVIANNDKI